MWDIFGELECNATVSPGVLGIPEGAKIVHASDIEQRFIENWLDDKPETEPHRARQTFKRAIEGLIAAQPAWLKKKGENVWRT